MDEAGIEPTEIEGSMSFTPSYADAASVGARRSVSGLGCTFPPKVCRRWMELHALRCEMVERNLYLVLINVERYAHTTASRMDLVQEGATALFRAVDGFDWRRGLLFRNSLLDENASSHVALGAGYTEPVEGSASLDDEARLERGINVSTIHIDLMVGGPEVDVDGIGADGSVVAILDQGRWVLS